MVCCINRKIVSPEGLLCLYEQSLGLSRVSSAEIEGLTQRFSSQLKLSLNQLIVLCEKLQIKKGSSAFTFLYMFQEKETVYFNTQALTTFAILIGSGTSQEKIELLFKNYCDPVKRNINPNQVELMLHDILDIAIDKMCEFVSNQLKETQKSELFQYWNALTKSKNLIIYVHLHNLIGEKTCLELKKFCDNFRNGDSETLLRMYNIRTIGVESANKMMSLAEKVNKVVKNNFQYDRELAKKLSMKYEKRTGKHRRTASQ